MYVEDLRPLKRPKLGFPDYYPQDKNQKEVNKWHYGYIFTNCITIGPTHCSNLEQWTQIPAML